jgi:diacylglycerol kinase (CTP)
MTMAEVVRTQRDLHLQRKFFHVVSVSGILSCMLMLPSQLNWTIYFSLGIPLVLLDFSRRFSSKINDLLVQLLAPLLRQRELHHLSGGSYGILGIGLTYWLYPSHISQLAVLFLAIGDPVASLFGLLYGRKKIFAQKSWVGSMAAFFTCSLAATVYLTFSLSTYGLSIWAWGVCLGFIGALAELIPIGSWDDNLTQPLVSGFLMSLMFYFIQGPFYG